MEEDYTMIHYGIRNGYERFLAEQGKCSVRLTEIFAKAAKRITGFFLMVILCNLLHWFLRPLSQPKIISDTIIGLLLGNLAFVQKFLEIKSAKALRYVVDFGMTIYMFVLGLENDPYVLFRAPTQDAKVAYAGMVSTFIIAGSTTPFLGYTKEREVGFALLFSTAISGTASPVLTRMITNLKIGKSDIGRLVIAAGMHSDFITTLLLSLTYPFYQFHEPEISIGKVVLLAVMLVLQVVIAAKVSPFLMNWVNNENPEGKQMKASHLVLSIAFMALLVCFPVLAGYSSILSAFLAGTFLPREGRISRWVVGKVNYFLTTIFYPIFFLWMGVESRFAEFQPGQVMTWVRLVSLFIIITIGKVTGTVISGVFLGFHWPECLALGLLLTTKGHFHMYLAIAAKTAGKTTTSSTTVMMLVIFFTVVHGPAVIAHIIERARKRFPTQRMALQLLDPSSELRILLCLHGPQNIPTTINFMEIARAKPVPGIVVYVTDMIELTNEIASTLVQGEGDQATVTVTDRRVTEMRDQVTTSIKAYVDQSGEGVTFKRMLALSTFNDMPQDICILAEEMTVALIILPFHKIQLVDGRLDEGHSGFRYVNRKVLRNAPCSVGILVDRGLGIEKISRLSPSLNVGVIFIGGKDDREALAYAGRVARHPGTKLTVIRFLVDTNMDNSTMRMHRFNNPEHEEEMKQDDECFAFFYERHVAGGPVAYTEKHLADSSEAYSTLRSLEGEYSLLIVGRGGRVNSLLTVGMNDLQQCPELGPIGDILSGSEFLIKTSILIIQQPNLKGEIDGLNDDFAIM